MGRGGKVKRYLAILSEPYENIEAVNEHIAQAMNNGIRKIKRTKLFTLYLLSPDEKYYFYRVCRIVTEKDIKKSIYNDASREVWREHLEAQTERILQWISLPTTRIVEENKNILLILKEIS